jgi:hypothetical protein
LKIIKNGCYIGGLSSCGHHPLVEKINNYGPPEKILAERVYDKNIAD